jgi:hypothetical protein
MGKYAMILRRAISITGPLEGGYLEIEIEPFFGPEMTSSSEVLYISFCKKC